jgi:hypothetical protein
MRVIAFIEDYDVIRKILVHLALGDTRNHDPVARKNVWSVSFRSRYMRGPHVAQMPVNPYQSQGDTGSTPAASTSLGLKRSESRRLPRRSPNGRRRASSL